nr:class F sortase [Euzebyales bacterium]
LHDRDALAFVEVYQRTAPAAHAVARRLLGRTGHVEAALRSVYSDLWLAPPCDGSLIRWVRGRCFAVAAADLRHRAAAPAEPSVATLLDDLPTPTVHHLTRAERCLADLSERGRRAVLLAHDAGVASADQPDPDAADLIEAGLLALADPDAPPETRTPSGVEGLADWVLGLLPEADAAAVTAAIEGDRELAARTVALHSGRRRLEGLPASPITSQRVLADVLAAPVGPGLEPEARPLEKQRARRGGLGLVAASLVLVLLAGVLALTARAPVDQELAVAQSSPRPTRSARAPVDHELAVAQPSPRPTRSAAPAAPRATARPQRRATAPRIVPPARNAQQAQPAPPPVRVTIPKMQVDKRLVGLSVLSDGTLASPEDYGAPGWYREGVAPGDAGPAVIVGHVDSLDGPAVFFELETLRPGDKAHVKRADGTTVTFVVERVERVAKENFPTQQVYGPTPSPELRLITCGGAFDNTTRHYDDNVIAFAHLQRPRPRDETGREKDETDREKDRRGSSRSPDPAADA